MGANVPTITQHCHYQCNTIGTFNHLTHCSTTIITPILTPMTTLFSDNCYSYREKSAYKFSVLADSLEGTWQKSACPRVWVWWVSGVTVGEWTDQKSTCAAVG